MRKALATSKYDLSALGSQHFCMQTFLLPQLMTGGTLFLLVLL